MNDIVARLRMDAGRLTLAALIQEREAAACEIERLLREIARLGEISKVNRTISQTAAQIVERKAQDTTGSDLKNRTFLRLRDVCASLAMSHSTIYRRIAEGTFPAPVRISERSVRWRREDVDAWRTAIEVESNALRGRRRPRFSGSSK
jgi:prophage regulatory protein